MPDPGTLEEDLEESLRVLQARLSGPCPRIGIILGSGLGGLAEEVAEAASVPYAEVPHMLECTALGHVGRFVRGTLAGQGVLCMQGRLHGYEGGSAQEVAYPVWLLRRAGVETLIVTNAAGAINEGFAVGDFCIISDHINFTGRNPLAAPGPAALANRFVGMTEAYDPALRALAASVAAQAGVSARTGVYIGVSGPSFETPAEIRAFRAWGADLVGMSTVEEVIAARQMGMRVLGISLVTNMAAGIGGAAPDGEEVLGVAARKAADFARLMRGVLAGL